MQSTRRLAAAPAAAAAAAAAVVVIARLRTDGRTDGRKERSRGAADGRGRTAARRKCVDGAKEELEESGADRTGLISHLGVTRGRRRRRRRNDGAFSIFSLSLSLSLSLPERD